MTQHWDILELKAGGGAGDGKTMNGSYIGRMSLVHRGAEMENTEKF